MYTYSYELVIVRQKQKTLVESTERVLIAGEACPDPGNELPGEGTTSVGSDDALITAADEIDAWTNT